MTQQPGWGQQPQQQFPPQQGFPAQQQQFPAQQAPWGGQQAPAQPAQPQAGPPVQVGEEFDDFFTGGVKGAPGFDFGSTQNGGEKVIGSTINGTIIEMAKMQQRDYQTGNLLFWEPRSPGEAREPRWQVAITLQTELRNWQGVKPKLIPKDLATDQPLPPEADDGKRRVYAKGDLQRAINVACAAAGQKPRIGGKLAVRVRGFEATTQGSDKVLYEAVYSPAPEKAPTDAFFEQAAPAQPAPQQFPAAQNYPPAQQPQQAPVQQQFPVQPAPQQYAQAPAQGAPQQNPSTLGNAPAPTQAPEWALPQQQGYAPPQEQPAPAQGQIPSSQYAEPQF